MTFMAWPEIEGFHNIRKFTAASAHPEILNGNTVVTYRPKVKLHGTNAAVQVHTDGSIVCQSRESIITPEKDNAGFARWVSQQPNWDLAKGYILYGEWCGPGIQKGVAISQIPQKVFAIFAARPIDELGEIRPDALFVEPDELKKLVENATRNIPGVYVLPWYNEGLDVDWAESSEELTKDAELINEWVSKVEANDPWVQATFNVQGTGEGLVFYPRSDEHLGFTNFTNLVFKAKGEKHKNIATAKPAQVDASTAASVDAFVAMVLTEARLEQGATKVSPDGALTYDMKNTGKFVTWVSADVEKETQDELAASGLTFKQVQKAISDKARAWYIGKAKTL
jgi:hypothetical protein